MSTATDQAALQQGVGMTLQQLEEYQKKQTADQIAEQKATGQQSVYYGGGYSSAPQSENSVKLSEAYDGMTWYDPGTKRTIAEGTAGADETFMSNEDYAQVQALKQQWAEARAAGDAAGAQSAHDMAEAIRAKYGYSGDTETRSDGGGYTVLQKTTQPGTGQGAAGGGTQAGTAGGGADQMRDLLDQWKLAAIDQANGQIDYAVLQAVNELERALADAQPQFKEQAQAAAKDEMQALDNSALYAEARGDRGGIGQSQYNEIQAAAAQNRLAVQQAQTKLSTDTARQIADLRAKGEFEKADKALEITQNYLSQLISLEQWAAEFGLSQQQFQESIRQWEAEYQLAMQQFQVDTDLAYGNATGVLPSSGQLTLNGKSQLAGMGEALLSAGIMPNAEQLSAMGMTESQAKEYLTAAQLQSAAGSGSSGGGSSGSGSTGEDYEGLYAAAYASQNPQNFIASNYKNYGFTKTTGLYQGYQDWRENGAAENGSYLYKNEYSTLVGYARKVLNNAQTNRGMNGQESANYLYDTLRVQGYPDAVIDQVFAELGL